MTPVALSFVGFVLATTFALFFLSHFAIGLISLVRCALWYRGRGAAAGAGETGPSARVACRSGSGIKRLEEEDGAGAVQASGTLCQQTQSAFVGDGERVSWRATATPLACSPETNWTALLARVPATAAPISGRPRAHAEAPPLHSPEHMSGRQHQDMGRQGWTWSRRRGPGRGDKAGRARWTGARPRLGGPGRAERRGGGTRGPARARSGVARRRCCCGAPRRGTAPEEWAR